MTAIATRITTEATVAAATQPCPRGPRPSSSRYPALDGFRGVAVAAVVLFHLFGRAAPGGAVGLSMFFTLSGFLITTVILTNIERNGRFSAREFWSARSRRILPAALFTTAAVSVLRVTTGLFPWTRRGDALATVLQYNNWHFLFPSRQDEEMLGQISAVRHMWSLAVEEQFYCAVALITVVLTWMAHRRASIDIRRSLMWVAVSGMAASWALPAVVHMRYERIFFATDTRAGEILAGVVLATLVFEPPAWWRALRGPILTAGVLSLLVLVYWTTSADPFVIRDDRLVLPFLSAASVLCIAAGTIGTGPGNAALRTGVMRWLGLRSYGIYLYHQPLSFLVSSWLPGQSRVAHGITTVAITCVVAEASYRLIEMPVRDRRVPTNPTVFIGLALVLLVVGCEFVKR